MSGTLVNSSGKRFAVASGKRLAADNGPVLSCCCPPPPGCPECTATGCSPAGSSGLISLPAAGITWQTTLCNLPELVTWVQITGVLDLVCLQNDNTVWLELDHPVCGKMSSFARATTIISGGTLTGFTLETGAKLGAFAASPEVIFYSTTIGLTACTSGWSTFGLLSGTYQTAAAISYFDCGFQAVTWYFTTPHGTHAHTPSIPGIPSYDSRFCSWAARGHSYRFFPTFSPPNQWSSNSMFFSASCS